MYRVVPWSLIAIHFDGALVVPVYMFGPLLPSVRLVEYEWSVKALFVVSKFDPPTTVIPPFAVSSPVSVVVEVTAKVDEHVVAPVTSSVEPQLTVPLKVLLPENVCARPRTATVSVAVISGRLSCRFAVTTLGTMVVVNALVAFLRTTVPATPPVGPATPSVSVVKAPVLAVVPPMAPGVVSAVAMSAVAMAR